VKVRQPCEYQPDCHHAGNKTEKGGKFRLSSFDMDIQPSFQKDLFGDPKTEWADKLLETFFAGEGGPFLPFCKKNWHKSGGQHSGLQHPECAHTLHSDF
jgi:hypothetical protein